jgi:ABC-type transport system involved in multi-copper enzyme maturation permease subunit
VTSLATATSTGTAAPRPDTGSGGVSQARAIVSEWIKLRSLRSTVYSLLAAVVIEIGLGALFSAIRANRWSHMPPGEHLHFDPTQVSLRGMFLAQLAIGVLGVLVVTGEYSTGMIRATLSAIPRRAPVLWAKLVVFSSVVFVVMFIASLVSFLIGQAALSSTHAQASLSSPGAARAVLGAALYLTILGMLGIGLGFLLRNTAGAIATLFGMLLVLPALASALPDPWSTDVTKFLPMPAGTAATATVPDSSSLGPWAGLGVFALYAVAAVAGGLVVLRRRDA